MISDTATSSYLFDEHHRRQVVKIPRCRNLDETGHRSSFERLRWIVNRKPPICSMWGVQYLHPMLRMLLEVDGDPLVASSQPIALTVMMRQGVIIFESIPQHKLRTLLTCLPPRSYNTPRRLTLELRDKLVALIHHSSLLLQSHSNGIFMTIAMQTNFVARIHNHSTFFGKRFERVSRDKPGGGDVVLLKQLEESSHTDRACEEASTDI